MYELFTRGGPLMYPLLACSIVSLTIIIERVFFWIREARRANWKLIDVIFRETERGDYAKAISLGNESVDLAARVLIAGLAHRNYGLRDSMEVAADEAIARMRRGLGVLDTIITMAPLLGILGTVLGIIQSFDLLSMSGIQHPKAVTGGIAQALITTAAGLSIAIGTLIPFNYFAAKVHKKTKYLEAVATSLEVAYKKGLGSNDAPDKRV